MEWRRVKVSMIVVVVATATTFWSQARAQSGCTPVLVGLSPCLNYISGNSSTPSSSCCSQLSRVVQSQPQCLCAALNGGASSSLGITINQTRALELPNACDVQTPPASRCNDAAAAAPAPGSSSTTTPADSSHETPTSGTGSGSKTTTNSSAAAAGCMQKIPIAFTILAALFISSCIFSYSVL